MAMILDPFPGAPPVVFVFDDDYPGIVARLFRPSSFPPHTNAATFYLGKAAVHRYRSRDWVAPAY